MPIGAAQRTPSTPPSELTIPEAAELLRVCKRTIYNLIQAGELPTYHVGRCRRIRMEALQSYIERQVQAEQALP